MRNTLQCRISLAVMLLFASARAGFTQNPKTFGYTVKQPVRIGTSGISVQSVRIYGSTDALVDTLLRSGFFDCNCLLLKASHCNLSVLKLESIPNVEPLPAGVVRIVIPKSDDFIRVYNGLSKTTDAASMELSNGIARGRRFRNESQQPAESEKAADPAADGKSAAQETETACKRETKLCATTKSVSFSIGCEGLGELEISTDGEVSLSLSAGSVKVPHL